MPRVKHTTKGDTGVLTFISKPMLDELYVYFRKRIAHDLLKSLEKAQKSSDTPYTIKTDDIFKILEKGEF